MRHLWWEWGISRSVRTELDCTWTWQRLVSREVLANGQSGIALEDGGEAGRCKGQVMGKGGRMQRGEKTVVLGGIWGKRTKIFMRFQLWWLMKLVALEFLVKSTTLTNVSWSGSRLKNKSYLKCGLRMSEEVSRCFFASLITHITQYHHQILRVHYRNRLKDDSAISSGSETPD